MLCTAIFLGKIYLTGCLITFGITSIPLWPTLVVDGKVNWSWMIPAIIYSLGSWFSLISFGYSLYTNIQKVKND